MANLKADPTLADLQAYVAEISAERGYQVKDIAKKFMILTEEVGELAKAARKRAGIPFAKDSSASEIEHEAADVLMALLSLSNMLGIDLEQAFRAKEEKNKLRTWK